MSGTVLPKLMVAPKLMAVVTLLVVGAASAHVIPLDVTLQAQGSTVLAHIVSPDGLNVSGVKLNYQLGSAAPVAFRETAVPRDGRRTVQCATDPGRASSRADAARHDLQR